MKSTILKMMSVAALFLMLAGSAFAQKATLSWTPSPTAGVTYNVYRNTTGSPCDNVANRAANKINSSPVTTTSYVDLAVSPGVTYFWQVTATNANGESTCTTQASAAIPAPAPPGQPTQLVIVVSQ